MEEFQPDAGFRSHAKTSFAESGVKTVALLPGQVEIFSAFLCLFTCQFVCSSAYSHGLGEPAAPLQTPPTDGRLIDL